MDYIWVPSEFNKRTFAQAGVAEEKLVVIPECMDVLPYRRQATSDLAKSIKAAGKYTFLSIFDWTLHKGWDLLLKAFYEEFKENDQAALILKIWSSNGYKNQDLIDQASNFSSEKLGWDILRDSRVRFVFDRIDQEEMAALYQSVDCYVLPSRGEGWGRPYMEAMATGLPVIATNWSGNTQFMNGENSYLVNYQVEDVPEKAWREVGTYRGHRWAEPFLSHLRSQMRYVYEHTDEARLIGAKAAADIQEKYNQQSVGQIMAAELRRIGVIPAYKPRRLERSRKTFLLENERAEDPSTSVGMTYSAVGTTNSAVGTTCFVGQSLLSKELETTVLPNEAINVRWEGSQFQWHSLAHVNREICLRLLSSGVELSLIPGDRQQFSPADIPGYDKLADRVFATLPRPADVTVRHFFPPRFEVPMDGKFVLMQPWEYGSIPKEWVEPIKQRVSEVWCNSTYVRDVYARSGIPESKLQLVPLGVDIKVFNPEAPPYVFTIEPGAAALNLKTEKCFTFLFVGGSINRKGIDILLEAYINAFSAYDNVCLVIKDTGIKTVYGDCNEGNRITQLAIDKSRPRIVYIDDDLSAHQLAGIYTAADCLVQPYRGEGFCLPALEAMATGIPVIVPEGGPTDDFVDETVGWRLPAEHKPIPGGMVGHYECVLPPWLFEIAPEVLAQKMRSIAFSPEEAKEKGKCAAERVQKSWTWEHTSAVILERLKTLQQIPALPPVEAEQVQERSTTGESMEDDKAKHGRRLPKISLCMIARDEERVIGDCLTSIKPWVDEIIFVDTGSSDKTVEIASSFGAQIHHFPWCDDFSAARNESISHATGDWILWMDADDTIPEDCGKKLHELALLADRDTFGFMIQVQIPAAPGETGFTIVDHVKLFRNLPGLRFEGRIHEQILEAIHREGGVIERSDLYVVHSGYDYSPEGQKKKRARDLTILEKDLADRPDHPFVLFNIGMTAFHTKDFDKAIPVLEKCIRICKPTESIVRKLYAMRAGSALETGDIPGAVAWVQRGLTLFPRDPELLFRAGIIFREAGDLNGAAVHYNWLLTERETGHIDSIDVSMTTYKAHHNLAVVLLEMGRPGEAEQHFEAALRYQPDFSPSATALAELRRMASSRRVTV